MMSKRSVKTLVAWMALALSATWLGSTVPAHAEDDERIGFERTPPRLSYLDGEVSFWRPGAEEWTAARVNTGLAAGDELYTGEAANLELQIGARAFARAGEDTQFGLTSLEPDFLQLRVASGHVSLDLRSLTSGQTLELGTPNAAFTVERSGYYRVEVEGDTTTFTSRRGGRARLTAANGETIDIGASEQVVVSGTEPPQIASYAAPELDSWDRWNYARTDDQLDAVSARYVPSGVYGTDDLDHHGDWRVVPTYGAVWVPRGVASGWAPYSTGRWMFDPYYGWSWVDDAPWGWAPYHYGRWVRVSGYWGWCPGPLVARPLYAPALVGFYGGSNYSVGISFGAPYVSWVALGWGEPLVPWWGPTYFRQHAHWAGWRGPRYVNKVVVKNKTVYKAKQINIYQNAGVRDAVVGVDRKHFGRRGDKDGHYRRMQGDKLTPVHGGVDVKPDRSSLAADARSAKRPPKETRGRSIVATREPRVDPEPSFESRQGSKKAPAVSERGVKRDARAGLPPTRVATSPQQDKRRDVAKRAPFGTQSETLRDMPPPPPRFQKQKAQRDVQPTTQRGGQQVQRDRQQAPAKEQRASAPERQKSRDAAPAAPAPKLREKTRATRPEPVRGERVAKPPRVERSVPSQPRAQKQQAAPRQRDLPGEPANRVYRGQQQQRQQHQQRAEPRSVQRGEKSAGGRQQKSDGGGGGGGKGQANQRGQFRTN